MLLINGSTLLRWLPPHATTIRLAPAEPSALIACTTACSSASPDSCTASVCMRLPTMTSNSSLAAASRRSAARSEEHTSELQSLMRISYAVCCLKKQHPQLKSHDWTKPCRPTH